MNYFSPTGTRPPYGVKILLLAVLAVLAPLLQAQAQPIPVGDVRQEQHRLLQLLSDTLLPNAMVNLPLWQSDYRAAFGPEGAVGGHDCEGLRLAEFGRPAPASYRWWACPLESGRYEIFPGLEAGLYDPVVTAVNNSALPYGSNNGAAWYGAGLTSVFEGGLWITSPYFTATFRPQVSWQQNGAFRRPRFAGDHPVVGINPEFGAEIPFIDMPWRFGDRSFTTAHLGQSSLRLHYSSLEAGVSTENLWWGPAVQYPLVMSNNAPGLRHVFAGTRSPLELPLGLGGVEGRMVWAWPEDSPYFQQRGADEQRFMSAMNAAWTPGFIPGLTLGFTRVFHIYVPEDGLSSRDIFRLLQPFQKSELNPDLGEERDDASNQLASVYLRWVVPEAGLEIYGEYYRDDHNWDLRDFLMEPHHQRAYTLGMQKVIRSGIRTVDFFRVNAEINSLLPTRVDDVRPQLYIYTHDPIRQGHTNGGQVMGAAIGPGSGSQYLSVDAFMPSGQAGLFVQRVENNDFFHYEYYDEGDRGLGYKDLFHNWISLNVGLIGRYRAGPLLLSGQLVWNKHFNYGRYDYGFDRVDNRDFSDTDWDDVVNWQLRLGVRYYLDF